VETEVKNKSLQTFALTLVLTMAALPLTVATSVFAQDVIGAAPVSQSAIYTFKAIAVAGVGWGFLRLMSGRHTVEGLTVMAAGALGLAKTQAVVALLGIG
jgi:uncharacterized protein (UPF0261 family)